MLCGYNTNGLQNHRLDEALLLLADHGYRAVALTLDVGHLDPMRATPGDIDATRRLLERLDLRPIVETGARYVLDPAQKHEPTLMTRDRSERDRRVAFYRHCAAIGRDLGAELLSFWGGVDHAADAGSEDAWAWLEEGAAATCDQVRELGLEPCLEPEPGMAIDTLSDYSRLVDALGSKAPSLTFDLGHAYVNETESVPALIQAHADRLRHVHMEDMRRGVHEHLVPGEGDVDFRTDLATLRQVGFRGAVCFELSRSSHMAPKALEICRAVWADAVPVDRD